MKLYEVIVAGPNLYKVILEPQSEGTYIFEFVSEKSTVPERDWLVDDLEQAMETCEEDYKIFKHQWQKITGKSFTRTQ